MAGNVSVQLGDGSIGTVAPEDVQQVIDSGGKVVEQKVVHEAKVQDKYGQGYGTVVAAPLAAARGLTGGLSDAALVKGAGLFGGQAKESTRALLQGTEEANPLTSTVSEIGGAILPALFTGGASAAAEGAAGVARSAVARGAASLAKEAAIGGFYGAGGAVSEAALSNEDLSAEHLLAETAKGALFGGAVGGALHGLGAASKILKRPGAEAVDELASKVAGGEVEGVADHMASMPDAPHPETQGLAEHAVQDIKDEKAGVSDAMARKFIDAKFGSEPDLRDKALEAWETRGKSFGKAAKANDEATLKIKDALTQAEEGRRHVENVSFGEAKIGQMSDKVDPALHKEALSAAENVRNELQSKIDLLEQDEQRGGIKTPLNKFKQEGLKKFDRRLSEAMTGPQDKVAVKTFAALDQLKRDVGRLAQFGQDHFSAAPGAREFDDLYHNVLMPTLEHEGTFGEAGAAQKEINEAFSRRMQLAPEFRSKFLTHIGNDKGRPVYGGNSSTIASHVGQIGKVSNLSNEELLSKQLHASLDEIDALDKHYTYSREQRASLDTAKKQYKSAIETVEQHTKEARGRNFMTELREAEQKDAYGGAIAGGMLGHVLGPAGGLIGAALGQAHSAFASPARTLERLAQAEELQQKGQKKINDLVGRVFRREPGAQIKPREFQDAIDDSAKRAASGTSERAVNEEAAKVSDPAGVQARATAHAAPFEQAAPNMSKNYIVKASAAATFLQSKTPKPLIDPYSLTAKSDPKLYNANDVAAYNLYKDAVTDPTQVLHNIGTNSLQPEQVEAVKTVYPAMYASMVTQMLAHIDEKQPDLDFDQKSQLGIFLGRPVDQAFDPAFIAQLQKVAMGQTALQAPGKPPKGNGSAKPQGAIKMTPSAAAINTGDYETASSAASDFGEDDT